MCGKKGGNSQPVVQQAAPPPPPTNTPADTSNAQTTAQRMAAQGTSTSFGSELGMGGAMPAPTTGGMA